MNKYTIKDLASGATYEWTLRDILNEINTILKEKSMDSLVKPMKSSGDPLWNPKHPKSPNYYFKTYKHQYKTIKHGSLRNKHQNPQSSSNNTLKII